jgi:amino acid adenylation domain-containing protein
MKNHKKDYHHRISQNKRLIFANQNTREKEFWFKKLAGKPGGNGFPFEGPEVPGAGPVVGSRVFSPPPPVSSLLTARSDGSDYKLHIILMAGVMLLLHKYTGSSDIMIVTPIYKPETSGELINTVLPIRVGIKGSMTFHRLLRETAAALKEAAAYVNYPVDLIPRKLNPESPGIDSFFDVAVLLQDIHHKHHLHPIIPRVSFSFQRSPDGIDGLLEYDTALYKESDIREIIESLMGLLEKAVQRPDEPVSGMVVTVAGRRRLETGEPDIASISAPPGQGKVVYRSPRDEIEKKLVEIWGEVLEVDSNTIGIDDVFFALDGQSLKAIMMTSKIHKAFNISIPLPVIFKLPTVRGLADHIKKAIEEGKEKINRYASIRPVEKKEYYLLSSAQKRLYILNRLEPGSTAYNVSQVILLEEAPVKERLERVFQQLIRRHDSLRTSFRLVGERPVQKVHEQVPFSIEYYQGGANRENETIIENFPRPFDLTRAPLLRAGLIAVKENRCTLMVDVHHIISDATTRHILAGEFTALYDGEKLPPLRLQYKDYSEWCKLPKQQRAVEQQEKYWMKQLGGEIPVLNLPLDYPRPLMYSFAGNAVDFILTEGETRIIKNIAKENEATLYMTVLSIYTILLSKLSGQEDIIVGTPVVARRHTDLNRIVGMFVNTLAMRNYPSREKTFEEFAAEVRNSTLEAFENQEYQFEELVEKVSVQRDTSRNPIFDVMFNLLNQEDYSVNDREIDETGFNIHRKSTSKFDLNLAALDFGERIFFNLEYGSELFKKHTIDRIIGYFKNLVSLLAEKPGIKLAQVEITTGREKEEILKMSVGIEELYNKGKTLQQLFQEQVQRTPDNIALLGPGHGEDHIAPRQSRLTYRELNEKSNRLARILRSKGVGKDTVVGLVVPRSLEMIIAILAIIKAGGAYLPIDPEYPSGRVRFMLEDSGASIVLTTESMTRRFSIDLLTRTNTHRPGVVPMVTSPRKPVHDLDWLPIPDRSLVNYKKYHQYIASAMAKHTVSLLTSRGCPYRCIYCNKVFTGRYVTRSAGNIFTEIKNCYEAGIRRFAFIDDVFNLDEKNASALLNQLIKNRMDVQLFFSNGLRGDILTGEFIDLMIEAGTVTICLALESASPRIQELIKKNLNLEKFRENVCYITKKYPHIILEMELMHGFPTETEEEAMMTLDFLLDIKWVHFPDLHILKIYPHTNMYQLAVNHGISEMQIARSLHLAYHQIPETLPFSKDFTRSYQARFLNEYFFLKERLRQVLSHQMKLLSEDELVQKYDSYLPMEIKCFADILECTGLSMEELGDGKFLRDHHRGAPDFSREIAGYFPGKEKRADAFRVLLLDLSLSFTAQGNDMLYDVVEAPLGLMYLLTYLNEKFADRVCGKILKSRIDFDGFTEMRNLVMEFKPDLIGIRTLSLYKGFFHRSVLLIRQWGIDAPIVGGGPYATTEFTTMLRDENVDLAVLGEGELTLGELIERMMVNGKRLPNDEILKQINGIAFIKKEDKSLLKQLNRHGILMDNLNHPVSQQPGSDLNPINTNRDMAYVIYTSGSTGKPKGVVLDHRNLVNLFDFQFNYTNIDCSRILQFATISFDASFHEIFSAFLSGGRLYLVDQETRAGIHDLFTLIARHEIKTVFFPMSFLRLVFSEKDYINIIPRCVRHIQTAGEQVVIGDNFKRYLRANGVYLHNHYGPSETHVVTTFTIEPHGEIPQYPSIGRPILNTAIYILDRGMHVVPAGAAGELYIGGIQVGRGYLNNPELTAEKFLFYKSYKSYRSYRTYISRRLYKTGDLARWLEDRNIEFLGRIDHQVKIRVELGEIESQLLKYPGIKEVVVIPGTDESGDKYLCAYIVPVGEPQASELREYLSLALPDYMIPSYFVLLEKIPLTPAGKIDRAGLPAPGIKRGENYAPPRDGVEKALVELWSEVLSIEKNMIGIDANFFELGGQSLKATIVIAKVHKNFHVRLPLAEVFKTPTIKELAVYIKNTRKDKYTSIEPVEAREYYDLSSAQKRLYIIQETNPGSTAYNMSAVVTLIGKLDRVKFARAFNKLIQRHESLRTSIHILDEEPVQKIQDEVKFNIEYYDIQSDSQDSPAPPDEIVNNFVRPFDLGTAPLLRVGLIKQDLQTHILMINMNHIISDGVSIGILENEFMAFLAGKDPEPLLIRYRDWAQWQKYEKNSVRVKKQETYWIRQFEGEIPALNLPLDYTRPVVQGYAGKRVNFALSTRETGYLNTLARQEQVTLYILLLSVYYVLLYKLTGQEDIIIGTPTAGRIQAELQKIIGMFLNTLALRNFPGGGKSFKVFLNEVKAAVLKAFENQEYQFDDLVDRLKVERGGRNPLFDVMFNLQNQERPVVQIPGLKLITVGIEHTTTKFDFSLYAEEVGHELLFSVTYGEKLFTPATITLIIDYFKTILSSVIKNPGQTLSDINVIPMERRTAILSRLNTDLESEAMELIDCGFFQASLNRSVHQFKDYVAIEYEDRSVSYGELDLRADCLCRWILRKGIARGTFMGILIRQRIDFISTMMGILKAGGVMVPLYPQLPIQRLEDMMQVIELEYIFADTFNTKRFEELAPAARARVFFINPGDIFSSKESLKRGHPPAVSCSGADRCYIYFTSGSTGKPKPIVGKNRSLLHFINWEIKTFGITSDFRVSQFTVPTFDPFLRDVFAPFLAGAKMCIPGGKETLIDSARLVQWVDSRRINLIHCVPALFRLLSPSMPGPGRFKSLKFILLAGEKINPTDLVDWYKVFGDRVQLVNIYGPTETTLAKIYYLIKPRDIDRERIPIGKPIKGSRVIILDNNKRLCAPMQVGEICIRTPFISSGYYNDPVLNKEKFITNPFSDNPKDILYRSGDLGRVLSDGNIDILGRIDRQIKIRGYRIEPEEVERALVKEPLVKEAVVTIKGNSREQEDLCAYITITANRGKNSDFDPVTFISRLKQNISTRLPDYMVPTNIVILERIPRKPGGKVDWNALPDKVFAARQDYMAPGNRIEKELVDIWAEVLSRDQREVYQLRESIGIDNNFFQLGGHSLKATILIARIHKKFGMQIPLVEFFKTPTIKTLAGYIQRTAPGKFVSLESLEKKEYYTLSSTQKRMYILHRFEENSKAYNIPVILTLEGNVNTGTLETVFKKLISRHESLRTSFETIKGEPVQRIQEDVEFEIEYLNISRDEPDFNVKEKSSSPMGNSQLDEIIIDIFVRPFDLTKAPLIRVGLRKIEKYKHILMIDMHHIISDGISHSILVRDFISLYTGQKPPSQMLQYKEYSEWQQSPEIQKTIKEQEEYWLKEFEENIPVLNLPADYSRPPVKSFEGDSIDFALSVEEIRRLYETARTGKTTLFMVILAVYNILLAKLSSQEDIVVGIPIAGRRYTALETIVGAFINTLALRNTPSGEKTFKLFLKEIKEKTIKSFENQDYQLEDLVEKTAVKRDRSRNPLFDVSFTHQNFFDITGPDGKTEEEIEDLKIRPYGYGKRASKFDLNLRVFEVREKLYFLFVYSTKLFTRETILRFIQYFKKIISSGIASPEMKIYQVDILPGQEKKRLLYDFNKGETGYPKDKLFHELFEEQVERTPNRVALLVENPKHKVPFGQVNAFGGNISITYRELNNRANNLASLLRAKNVKQGTIVGIMVTPSIEMVAGMIGVLKAGAAFLPIEPGTPPGRINYFLTDSSIEILLTKAHVTETFNTKAEIVNLEDANLYGSECRNPAKNKGTAAPVYLAYTPGNGRKPAGVLITHGNLSNYIHWFVKTVHLTVDDKTVLTSSFDFDALYTQLFSSLFTGSQLHILPSETFLLAEGLLNYIRKNKITYLKTTPHLFSFIVNHLEFLPGTPQNLRLVILVGEEIKVEDVEKIHLLCPHIRVMSHYGLTETTIGSIVRFIGIDEFQQYKTVPTLGKPIDNTRVYILEKGYTMAAIGVTGQLFIGGDGVAMGYLNNPELTWEQFPSPFHRSYRSHRSYKSYIYRTGVIARWRADGNIEFLGRIDSQVTIRGYRVDLEEIRGLLVTHPGIKDAVVVVGEKEAGEKVLNAYIVGAEAGVSGDTLQVGQLRNFLSRNLPDYMIPSHFAKIEKIPLTGKGKIDGNALSKIGKIVDAEIEYSPPTTGTEKKIANIWTEVLNLEKVSIYDDFFQLGGNSLTMITLTSRLREIGCTISLAEVMSNPTIKELTSIIDKRITSIDTKESIYEERLLSQLDCIEKLNKGRGEKNIFLFHPRHGMVNQYKILANLVEKKYNVYGVHARAWNSAWKIPENTRQVINGYLEQILALQKNGPYIIGGFCIGTIIGYEISRRLERMGHQVEKLILFDSHAFLPDGYVKFLRKLEYLPGFVKKWFISPMDRRFKKAIRAEKLFKRDKNDGGEITIEVEDVLRREKISNYMHILSGHIAPLELIKAPILVPLVENTDRRRATEENFDKMTTNKATVVETTGDHNSMWEKPYVEKLAEIILNNL